MSSWNQPGPGTTTPTGPPAHGTSSARGLDAPASSHLPQGRFGRMFRTLPIFEPAEDKVINELSALAKKMVKDTEEDKPLDAEDEDQNPDIPAGYTYLGQFIDHDITFDPVSSLQRQNDPDALDDFRTPRFDLDSVYGRGPADQPYLYDKDDPAKLRLGLDVKKESAFGGPDLPRLDPQTDPPDARALIGDPRNDENLIVSQLQSTVLRFHNAIVDRVRSQGLGPVDDNDAVFKEAQRLARWHYQWVVVHDFLRQHVVGAEIVDDILRPEPYVVSELPEGGNDAASFGPRQVDLPTPTLRFYEFENAAFMPVEFSAAAYRFGHSMVRPSYFFNDFVRGKTEPNRTKIFSSNLDPRNLENLNGARPLPADWGFQWKYFFPVSEEEHLPQPSYRIDDELVNPLGDLPNHPPPNPPPPDFASLAFRNLLRGVRLGLPSGQAVSQAMGIVTLGEDELALADVAPSFAGNAPLWYYVLRESKVRANGRRLGPVGGRIVAEVLIGLLAADPLSYLRVEPSWTPVLGDTEGQFAVADLIKVAGAD
jgi:hypothetical protein